MRPGHVLRGIATLAALAFAGLSVAAVARSAPAELTRSGSLAIPVTWSELTNAPCGQRGREVRFAFQFHGRPERWQAGPTRFGPGAFAAVSGWADEQFPWIPEEFDRPSVRVFVRRGSPVETALRGARQHQRFEVTGIVREVWRDWPWIELTSAVRLDEEIGEATVFHAGRALELMGEGAYVLAEEALLQALAGPLPPHARSELSRLKELCTAEVADPKPAPIRPRRR